MEPESSVKNLPKSQGPFSASGALKSKSKLADGALEQAIDHYIKESKQYDLTKYYTEGFYLDVRDDFSWCTAYIKAVNKENGYIDVHFDNWAEKYDEECNGNSESKVLPLRYASEGYTGQKKSTLRPYDARLTKKEYIMEKMSKFSASKFLCQDQEEIQEMYQFICGELYLYIDSALTCEEKEVKKDVEGIIEIINGFIEMLQVWLSVAPDYIEYYPMMQKYPKLYLVCPQAAILNLYKSFQPSLELMFHDSPRSVEFMKTASYKLETESTICKPLTRNIHSIRLYFMEILINNKCIERLIEWINISNKSKAPDLRIILSILTSLAPTYNNVQIKHEIDECFKLAICDYLYEEETGIVSKIKCLPDSQLKDIKQEEFVKVLKDFYNCNKTTVPREAYISRVQFDILLMFLQSPYIDKKLTAMNEIKKMFEKKSRSRDTASNKVIAKFLAESDMLNYIYQEAKHPELITRSADLIIILNDHNLLEVETLQMIWETCINEHKHEAVTEATLNVISTVARHLDKDMVKIFLDNIQSLPLQMLAENIGIIKEFYMNFYSNLKSICGRSRAEKEMAEAANLKILWEAVQDESEVNSKHKFATLDALIELMILFDLTNTSEFFISAVEYLREGKSSVKCMIMIEKILESLSRRGYPSIIKKEDLIALAIQSAEVYINNARENSPMEGGKIEDMIFSGGLSHKDTINKYFGFITNLLTNFEGHNKLTNDHIDYMFKVFVKESISKVERSSFYNFFTFDEFDTSFTSKKNIASSRNREYLFNNILCKELNSTNTGTCEFKCFETNFFNVNCSKKNLKRQSNEQVFRTIKMGLEGLDLVWDFSIFSENDQIRNQCNNFLADLYLYYEKESCKKRGENNSTFFHSWIEKIMTIDEQNNQGIANILDLLFHFVKRYDGDHMDDEYFEKMDTDFTVEFQDHPPNTPKKKIFKINKEMTLGAIRKRIGDFYKIIPSEILIISGKSYLTECCMLDKLSAYRDCRSICIRRRTREERELELPRYLAGANLNVMQQVIEKGLQSDNHDLRCKSLQFLEYIPPNNERREKMIKCKKISKGVTQSDWFRFMYCDGYDKQGLYYGLKVMKSILTPFEPMYSKADRTKFSQEISFFQAKFLEYDGFPLLCETLKELNVESALKDVVWLSIFQMITEILMKLLDDIDFVNASLKNKKSKFPKAITKLILSMTQILSTVSESISLSRDLRENLLTPEEVKTMSEEKIKNTIEEYELFENNFCSNCIDLLSCCFSIAPDDFGTFYESPFIEKEGIVNLLTFYPNKRAMKKVADSLYNMCEKFRGDDRVLQNPAYFLIALLQKDMEIVHRSPDVIYTEYFNLWDKVIRLVSIEESRQCLNSVEVATSLYSIIHKRKLIEDDYQQDTVLSGCLRLLETLDEYFHEDLKAGLPNIFKDKFLYFLLSDALFDRKKVEDDKDSEMRGQSDTSLRMLSHDDLSYPLCKHQETRKYAFRLLNRLFGERKMPQIAAFIENYIRDGSWRTNKRDKWFLHPSKLSQRKTHVGLVNLGCTCYMNSMMQQLFMSPHFRTFICNVQDNKRNEVPLEDNVLYQAKYLFANLIKSKMPVFNPTALFNSVKDMTGQALPTNEQRDVDEFFSMFLDQAEKNFIGTKGEQDLKKIFGGTFAQQLICIGCPHRSSREEPYLTMSLEIKNKANIKEALDLFIKGDMLEGDNAYYCDRCDKKVDTLKRCCVKKLPNFLILGLKRFEFDLETFTRCKLNSRFEFYEDLDMRDYCQETLAKKELIKKMNDDNLTYEMLDDAQKAIYDYKLPDQYYQYKLKGVVVHYGTVDGGHYYSYIKERGTSKWYEFNDTSVRDYDPADLADDTFGGTFKHARRSDRSGRVYRESERLHNAYVLIYEREEYLDSNKVVDLVESGQQDFRELVNSCTIPLERLKIEDDILQELTSSYDKTWIANKMFDDSFIDTVLQMCKNSSMYL